MRDDIDDTCPAIDSHSHIQSWCVHCLRQELKELRSTFDLRWKADMSAIKLWHDKHPGKRNVWPDHADLVVWLMENLT